ncbi:MAG TPA: SDR family oxidoreductase [Planctomycetota bacterium]
MNVLVLGASGQVGGHLLAALKNHEARGTSRKDGDLRDRAALDRLAAGADAVICAAGLANPDVCEENPGEAYAVNIDGARAAAEASKAAHFTLFSTDHVFDGREGPYGEDDRPAPINVYGRTKLEAERIVLTVHPRALVIRTSLVFAPGDKSFFSKVLTAAAPVPCWTDHVGTPTYGPNLAEAVVELVERGATGIWHVAGTEAVDRHAFGLKIAARFGTSPSLLRPAPIRDAAPRAPRPLRAGLRVDKAAAFLRTKLLSSDAALELAWRAHAQR